MANRSSVHTPGKGAIADVAEFLGISPAHDIKTVAYMARGGQPVAVFLRGDHSINEIKLLNLLGASEFRPMQADELTLILQGPGGISGTGGASMAAEKPMSGGLTVVARTGLSRAART